MTRPALGTDVRCLFTCFGALFIIFLVAKYSQLNILLIDPPSFPKGIKSIRLPGVAAVFKKLDPECKVEILDLNFSPPSNFTDTKDFFLKYDLIGISVGAQSFDFAKSLTLQIKSALPDHKIIWGGEFPTLLNEMCTNFCDAAVAGDFASSSKEFWSDYMNNQLKKSYGAVKSKSPVEGVSELKSANDYVPLLNLVNKYGYWNFMGDPIELTRGCIHKCTFCLVHKMQSVQMTMPLQRIKNDLSSNPRKFLNVVDYNVAIDREHLIGASQIIGDDPNVLGWMCEMCIETFEDTELVNHLAENKLRIVYCGLESADPDSLASVNKRQNNVVNYEELIRKAQKAGIEIGAGLILGLGSSSLESIKKTVQLYNELGLIYMKITFLTFNPGTKVNTSMRSLGSYTTEEVSAFDGLHVSFLFRDQTEDHLYEQARYAINEFYSFKSILYRSRHLKFNILRRLYFMFFSYCYGLAYKKWLQFDILKPGAGKYKDMVAEKFQKGILPKFIDSIILKLLSFIFIFFLVNVDSAFAQTSTVSETATSAQASTDQTTNLPDWANPKLPRETRIKSCANCHSEAYKAWQEGPHAQIHMVPSVKEQFSKPGLCYRCHSSTNIFDSDKLKDLKFENAHDKAFFKSLKPDFEKDFSTGTDCITCHVSGDKVFAASTYKPKHKKNPHESSSDFCNPIPDIRVEKSCIACHTESWRFERNLPRKIAEKQCADCHIEQIGQDKSHSYYWSRHYEFPGEGRLQKRIKAISIFKSLKISIAKEKNSSRKLKFLLKNDQAPHPLFSGSPREYLVVLKIPDSKNEYQEFKFIRFVSDLEGMELPKEIIDKYPGEYVSLGGYGSKVEKLFEVPAAMPKKGKIIAEIFFVRNSGEPVHPIKVDTKEFNF